MQKIGEKNLELCIRTEDWVLAIRFCLAIYYIENSII